MGGMTMDGSVGLSGRSAGVESQVGTPSDSEYPDLKGKAVPQEGPPDSSPNRPPGKPCPICGRDHGPNNEDLKEAHPDIVKAIWDLIDTFRTEGLVARRHEIRRIRQARLFWQGIQQGYYDQDSGLWQLPFGSSLGLGVAMDNSSDISEQPRYSFVTNYYLAYGLAFGSVMSQDVPTVRWWPRKPSSTTDIIAAKASSEAAELIEQNNQVQDKLTDLGYMLYTDGKVGGYVRYVTDGERFGYDEQEGVGGEPDVAQIGEDRYVCPNCGAETPVGGGMPVTICPECGTPVGPDNLQMSESVPVPSMGEPVRIPRGQEVIDWVGGLELNTPVWAKAQRQFPYLQWQLEVHRANLKASYSHIADKLESQYPSGPEDVYARASRTSVAQGLPFTHPGDALYTLITFLRTWVRPWAFFDIKDKEIRSKCLALFPNGCYIAFAGDIYCESREESMDDHWRVCHAYPGEGQSRPSVGDPMIDIQEQYNSFANILAENSEYGIPERYVDPEVMDLDALSETTAEPAAWYAARPRAGRPLAESFYSPDPSVVSPQMVQYMQELVGPIAQMMTGLFPAVFGGQMEDIKTAKAYAMARDQALGRLGLVWRRIKQFYADIMLLSVMCMRDNRPEDVEVPIFTESGEPEFKTLRLADLRGQIEAYPETDETFPRLKSEQRAVVQQLMESDDPEILQMLNHPANLGQIKGLIGLTDFVIPDEDSRNKQIWETEQMMQPGVGPTPTGIVGPDGQPVMTPSVPVDPILDNHKAEFSECSRFASSREGIDAHLSNPMGWLNFRSHALQHYQFMMMQEAAAASAEEGPSKSEEGKEGKPNA